MPDGLLSLQVLGVDGIIEEIDSINSIVLPMEDGSLIGLRPGHAPLIGTIAEGVLRYRRENGLHHLTIKSGILAIRDNKVRILTTSARF